MDKNGRMYTGEHVGHRSHTEVKFPKSPDTFRQQSNSLAGSRSFVFTNMHVCERLAPVMHIHSASGSQEIPDAVTGRAYQTANHGRTSQRSTETSPPRRQVLSSK